MAVAGQAYGRTGDAEAAAGEVVQRQVQSAQHAQHRGGPAWGSRPWHERPPRSGRAEEDGGRRCRPGAWAPRRARGAQGRGDSLQSVAPRHIQPEGPAPCAEGFGWRREIRGHYCRRTILASLRWFWVNVSPARSRRRSPAS
jgi:hypothetical protein